MLYLWPKFRRSKWPNIEKKNTAEWSHCLPRFRHYVGRFIINNLPTDLPLKDLVYELTFLKASYIPGVVDG